MLQGQDQKILGYHRSWTNKIVPRIRDQEGSRCQNTSYQPASVHQGDGRKVWNGSGKASIDTHGTGSTVLSGPMPVVCQPSGRMHGVPYILEIGSVLWPVVISWPDAVYAVGAMLQFMQNLGPAHWEGLK